MSLEPHWFSTIYGLMFLIGQVLETIAFLIAILVVIGKFPPFSEILTTRHFHDLGNLMLAFTVLWAYLSFSQFLIIWAGNLPEEIPWYLRRLHGGWGAVAVMLLIFHFFVPFVILLFRFVKKNPAMLQVVACWMILIRLVDSSGWWNRHSIRRSFRCTNLASSCTGWTFAAPMGLLGVWIAFFIWQLKRFPLVPVRDPRLLGTPKQMVDGLR